MGRKNFKRGGSEQFVQLSHSLLKSAAWKDLKAGPRALYVELKQQYTGGNNGELFLSHRDAAKALNCSRDTVANYFKQLEIHGFIVITQGHCLGPAGIGQANKYALTELPVGKTKATMDFKRWKKTKTL